MIFNSLIRLNKEFRADVTTEIIKCYEQFNGTMPVNGNHAKQLGFEGFKIKQILLKWKIYFMETQDDNIDNYLKIGKEELTSQL